MEIVRKSVLTVGGSQEQFVGLRIGEFLLVPDSDTGTRPDALRVTGPGEKVLVIYGGDSLRVSTHTEGITLEECPEKLTPGQRVILRGIAWNLPGRGWSMAGEIMQKRWGLWGDENILQALRALFKAAKKGR